MQSKTVQLDLFKKVYRIRRVENKIASLYPEQEMRCPVHLSIGQEAVAAGVCQALSKNDQIISSHRCHAHYLAKGGNLKKMIAEIYGKKTGCAEGLGGSMHLQDSNAGVVMSIPIVGSPIPIGAGIALQSLHEKKSKKYVTVIFFGEGATEEGIFHETINFASLNNLPILFVCENNYYSVYTSLKDRQPKKRKVTSIAKAHGVNSWSMDGNDVNKVFNISKKAIKKINSNSKPILLEFKTYRWLEHCGPYWDDNLNYRPKGELKKWIKDCPLEKVRKKIQKIFNVNFIEKIELAIDEEVNDAFEFAKKSNYPSKKDLNKFKKFYK